MHKALYMEAKLWEELQHFVAEQISYKSHRAALALADRYPATDWPTVWIASRQARDGGASWSLR